MLPFTSLSAVTADAVGDMERLGAVAVSIALDDAKAVQIILGRRHPGGDTSQADPPK